MSEAELYIFHGELGSGKTTAIQHMLSNEKFRESTIIENELASENIDKVKLGSPKQNIYDISGLCVCCSTGNELNESLNEAYNHAEGQPVILETTGAANIINVLKKVITDPQFRKKYRIASSIFVIGLQEDLKVQDMRSEIMVSDIVLLNKTDLVSEEKVHEIKKEVKEIQDIKVFDTQSSEFPVDELTEKSSLEKHLAEAVKEGLEKEHDLDRYEVVEGLEYRSEEQFEQSFHEIIEEFDVFRAKGSLLINGEKRFIEFSSGNLEFKDETPDTDKMVLIGGDKIFEAAQKMQEA